MAATNFAFAEVDGKLPPVPDAWWLTLIGSIIALVFAFAFYKSVMKQSEGTDVMREIAQSVREGAMAYLRQQYKVVTIVFIVLCVIFLIMAFGLHAQNKVVPFAFLTGGFFSGLCGFLGMKTATNASARTTSAAMDGLNAGLRVSFRAGAVMGLVVVGFALLDIAGWFLILYYLFPKIFPGFLGSNPLPQITVIMLSFGMGASTQALFARVGGGIYTKAADVGADLVGKVEAGIPEDDPRNPAVIADNVGDNVGDVAGMGADLYESYAGSILATAALGVAAVAAKDHDNIALQLKYLSAPMILAGIGVILSVLGIYMVRTKEGASMKQLMGSLNLGING
ncbi:MAG: sodium/proton-translocating pyrophosphatase, partial [Candidatus Poribacteria bacterium]|nr:sodium/proton-translocating pyrophosphatase [Candidatus Poribacteria bacterium]